MACLYIMAQPIFLSHIMMLLYYTKPLSAPLFSLSEHVSLESQAVEGFKVPNQDAFTLQ